jgi:streptogramin lyase
MRLRIIFLSITTGFALVTGLVLTINYQVGAESSTQEAPLNLNGGAYESNIDTSGQLWISDLGADEIWGVNPGTGTYTVYEGIQAPSDARRDSSGVVWWGDWDEGRFGRWNPATGGATWCVTPGATGLYGTQIDEVTGDFWVVSNFEPYLYRFQPGANQLCTYTLPLSTTVYYPQFHNGSIWLGDVYNSHLLRLDPVSDVFTTWELPDLGEPDGMAFDADGTLWFSDPYTSSLRRFHPDLNQLDTFNLPTGIWPEMIAFNGPNVWYTEIWDPAVGRLDPSVADHITTTLTTPEPPIPASVTCDLVAPSHTEIVSIAHGTLSWVDQTYSVLVDSGGWSVYGLPEPDVSLPWGIAVGSGYVWFVDAGRQVLGKIPLPAPYNVYLPLVVR